MDDSKHDPMNHLQTRDSSCWLIKSAFAVYDHPEALNNYEQL